MPLMPVKEMLQAARRERRCVAAFNCHNYESINTVIKKAEQMGEPVIVMFYPSIVSHIPLSTFAAITIDLAQKSKMPVGLHLDHSDNFEFIMEAISFGFHSVIVDASSKPYDFNRDLTRKVVLAAHPLGVTVEAELGNVGMASNASDYIDASKYTDPDLAVRFVEETGIDSLAIAIGNAHGHYVVDPHLDIPVLEQIAKKISIPLVLHGGSGIPDDQVRAAVERGIAKTNFGTYYGRDIYAAEAAYVQSSEVSKNLFGLLEAGEVGGANYVEGRIRATGGAKWTSQR